MKVVEALYRPCRARPADRSLVAEYRSAGGVRDQTGPEPTGGPAAGAGDRDPRRPCLEAHDRNRSQAMSGVATSRDGIPLAFEVHGAGTPTLVFVHGWSCDRRYWRGQVRALAARYQTVAVDLAGHGESGAGRRAWTMAAFGEDVVAVAEQLDLAELVLIGHSMGGDVIVEAAQRLGDRVVGLVWVDTYSTLGAPPTDDEIEAFVAPFREDFVTATRALVRRLFTPDANAELVEWVASDMSAAPPEIAIDALQHAVGNEPGVLAGLLALSAPVVAINPDSRPTNTQALRRHGVKAVLLSGVGHFLMLEAPDRFNRLLGEVIEELRG
jgi:pimeloyl-ACP methyl ester carboxylesterase